MKTPLYRKGCGPQGLGSPVKQLKTPGFTDKLYIKAEKIQKSLTNKLNNLS